MHNFGQIKYKKGAKIVHFSSSNLILILAKIMISARLRKIRVGLLNSGPAQIFFNKNLPAQTRPGCFSNKICQPGPGFGSRPDLGFRASGLLMQASSTYYESNYHSIFSAILKAVDYLQLLRFSLSVVYLFTIKS